MESTAFDHGVAQDHSSDTFSISDVNSGVFPAYSSRESIGSIVSSTRSLEVKVEPELSISPCINFVHGMFFTIEFDEKNEVAYKRIPLDDIPESGGRFHCMDCSLHFENKTELQIHLLKAAGDFDEKKSIHIVCPVCFIEFMPPGRVDRCVDHIKSKHDWEFQFVMHGKGLPGPHKGFDEQWREYMRFCSEKPKNNDDDDDDDDDDTTVFTHSVYGVQAKANVKQKSSTFDNDNKS